MHQETIFANRVSQAGIHYTICCGTVGFGKLPCCSACLHHFDQCSRTPSADMLSCMTLFKLVFLNAKCCVVCLLAGFYKSSKLIAGPIDGITEKNKVHLRSSWLLKCCFHIGLNRIICNRCYDFSISV